MGYRIEYGATDAKKKTLRKKPKILMTTGGIFALFLLITVLFWPEGKAVLVDIILPGDGAVTANALQELITNLRAGESFSDAVTVFCREIIVYGS